MSVACCPDRSWVALEIHEQMERLVELVKLVLCTAKMRTAKMYPNEKTGGVGQTGSGDPETAPGVSLKLATNSMSWCGNDHSRSMKVKDPWSGAHL